MDSLAQYGDDDESDSDLNETPGLIGPLPPSRANEPQWDAAPSSPPAQPRFVLPPPDFGDGPSEDHISLTRFTTQGSAGTKRGASAVSGTVLVVQGPPKSSRPPAATKTLLPAAASKIAPHLHASMLPPQLRGRSNVGTEDLEKMFGKQHFKAKTKE